MRAEDVDALVAPEVGAALCRRREDTDGAVAAREMHEVVVCEREREYALGDTWRDDLRDDAVRADDEDGAIRQAEGEAVVGGRH